MPFKICRISVAQPQRGEGRKGWSCKINKPIRDALNRAEKWKREGVQVRQFPSLLDTAGCTAEIVNRLGGG